MKMQSYIMIMDAALLLIVVMCGKLQDNFADCHTLKSRLFRNSTTSPRTLLNSTMTRAQIAKAALPPGLIKLGSVGNKSFYTDPDKLGLAWSESLDYCHELGFQPASLESLNEHKLVRNYLAKLPHRFFWLAGTDFFHEGHWKWLRSGENFKFHKWTQGYPSKSRKNNCLYLSYGNDGWIDASCSSNKLVIRPLCQSSNPLNP